MGDTNNMFSMKLAVCVYILVIITIEAAPDPDWFSYPSYYNRAMQGRSCWTKSDCHRMGNVCYGLDWGKCSCDNGFCSSIVPVAGDRVEMSGGDYCCNWLFGCGNYC